MTTEGTVDLAIEGMTCASCAARIEKKLNRLDGVTATVNYATETARVTVADGSASEDELLATVERLGYHARLPEPPTPDSDVTDQPDPALESLRQRLVVSAALALPVLLMAMVPALQFDNWQWLSLTLASPVVVWGAWPFHRAAWLNLAPRHGHHGHVDQRSASARRTCGRCTRCSSATPACPA